MYSELFQTSDIELFAIIVHGFQQTPIFAKSSILDVWNAFEDAPGNHPLPASINTIRESKQIN